MRHLDRVRRLVVAPSSSARRLLRGDSATRRHIRTGGILCRGFNSMREDYSGRPRPGPSSRLREDLKHGRRRSRLDRPRAAGAGRGPPCDARRHDFVRIEHAAEMFSLIRMPSSPCPRRDAHGLTGARILSCQCRVRSSATADRSNASGACHRLCLTNSRAPLYTVVCG